MSDDGEKPLDPAAARALSQVRRLMMIASATTFIAVAVVLGIIGYRVFRAEGSAPPFSVVTATLPAGAKVISTAIGESYLAVTIETAAGIEIRLFDVRTLKAAGRLRFATEP